MNLFFAKNLQKMLRFDSAANFLKDYGADYQSKGIAGNPGDRYYEWYLQKDIDLFNPSDFNSSDYYYVFVYNDLKMMIIMKFIVRV